MNGDVTDLLSGSKHLWWLESCLHAGWVKPSGVGGWWIPWSGNVDPVIHQLTSSHSSKPNQGPCTPYSDQTRLEPTFLSGKEKPYFFILFCSYPSPILPVSIEIKITASCYHCHQQGTLPNSRFFTSSCDISFRFNLKPNLGAYYKIFSEKKGISSYLCTMQGYSNLTLSADDVFSRGRATKASPSRLAKCVNHARGFRLMRGTLIKHQSDL